LSKIFVLLFAALGYVPKGGFRERTNIMMWDGAGSRANLGGNVGLQVPSDRYQDGVQMEVWALL
jgi:hypothetical protein